MQIKQSDLFYGTSHYFVKEIMAIARKCSFKSREDAFREGEPAASVYILITGQILLTAGDSGQAVYSSSKTGDVFGWSSLIGRSTYSASAHCETDTVLLRIDKLKLQTVLDKDPVNGMAFFKQLACALGNRLMEMYRLADAPT